MSKTVSAETTLLTDEDLEQLTGFKIQSKQCQVLEDRKITFVRDRFGRPRVTWYQINHPTLTSPLEQQPDFTSIGG